MLARRTGWVAVAFLISASAAVADSTELPAAPPGKCVLDEPRILDAASFQHLESTCESLDRSGAGQLMVAIVRDLRGLDDASFATALFEKWKPGQKGKDNGLLVVLAPTERKLRVEVGYGLEGALNDGKVGALMDKHAIPQLKQNQWGPGLIALVDALAPVAQAEAATGAFEQRAIDRKRGEDQAEGAILAGFWTFLLWLAWSIHHIVLRVRRILPGRKTKYTGMALFVVAAGLGLLMPGGFVGGVFIALLVFTGFGALWYWLVKRHECKQCQGWLQIHSRTLSAATYTSEGTREIHEKCTKCSFERTYTERIPRKQRSTSSSSSSGGSRSSGGFSGGGGGRSGGGGAGRSF